MPCGCITEASVPRGHPLLLDTWFSSWHNRLLLCDQWHKSLLLGKAWILFWRVHQRLGQSTQNNLPFNDSKSTLVNLQSLFIFSWSKKKKKPLHLFTSSPLHGAKFYHIKSCPYSRRRHVHQGAGILKIIPESYLPHRWQCPHILKLGISFPKNYGQWFLA
jgi:hypothetical protein